MEGNKSHVPGLVRISIGLYNTRNDIDRLLNALNNISRGEYSKDYTMNQKDGMFFHKDIQVKFEDYFSF